MTRSDALLRLTSRLIARRDALRKVLAEEVSHLQEPSVFPGHGDHIDAAVASAHNEICSRLAEIESRELAEIEQTLQRLAEGKYGRCESCHGRIPAARLNVLPCTTRCIACQRRAEGRGRIDAQPLEDEGWSGVDEKLYRDDDGDRAFNEEEFSVHLESTV